MLELSFDTGVKEYMIHGAGGDVVLRFNPADVNFVKEAYTAFDALQGKQAERAKRLDDGQADAELFDTVEEIDREMRSVIDALFGYKVADKIFGRIHAYTLSGGSPLWENLMLAVIEQFETEVKRERALADDRIRKHTGKYHK